jgi:hemoglobin-like flavoprotein
MALSSQDIELFNDSLERCTANPQFLARFYEIFLSSSPEVAEKFKNTNFNRQRRVLKSSLYLLIFAAEGKPEGMAHVQRMVELHGPANLNIPAYMYDLWMQSLLKAVSEHDPAYGASVEQAWRNMLAAGIAMMKDHHP